MPPNRPLKVSSLSAASTGGVYHICAKIREPVVTITDSLCSPENIREHRSGIFTTTRLPCAPQNIREQKQSKVDDEIRTPDCSMFDVFFISNMLS